MRDGKTVPAIGRAGFIGSRPVDALVPRGQQVRMLHRQQLDAKAV
jgi:hypothetical protein